ncbi:MAG: hypothetical protein CL878_13810 [Dehalococcoidia bacterium]|nr:hypothetical protein [Dehalococcoidia bacterium]
MLQSLRTTSGRIIIAVVATSILVALWWAYDMSIAILPAVVMPFWIALFVRQEEPVSPRARRFMLVSVGVGVLMLLVGITIYLYVAQR